MIELGKKQTLTVVKTVDFGVYLAEKDDKEGKDSVLLPAKQVPAGTKAGDELTVFIYKDSKDRLIATTREPMLQVGQTAVLKVSQVTRIGAFLNWGLEKTFCFHIMSRPPGCRKGKTYWWLFILIKASVFALP